MGERIETIKGTLRMIRGTLRVFWRMAKEDFDVIEDKPLFMLRLALVLAITFAVYYFIFLPLMW